MDTFWVCIRMYWMLISVEYVLDTDNFAFGVFGLHRCKQEYCCFHCFLYKSLKTENIGKAIWHRKCFLNQIRALCFPACLSPLI